MLQTTPSSLNFFATVYESPRRSVQETYAD
jgi:hypothetical protein